MILQVPMGFRSLFQASFPDPHSTDELCVAGEPRLNIKPRWYSFTLKGRVSFMDLMYLYYILYIYITYMHIHIMIYMITV